jgi:hypothetical protein
MQLQGDCSSWLMKLVEGKQDLYSENNFLHHLVLGYDEDVVSICWHERCNSVNCQLDAWR